MRKLLNRIFKRKKSFAEVMMEASKIKHGCMPYEPEKLVEVPCHVPSPEPEPDYKTREII